MDVLLEDCEVAAAAKTCPKCETEKSISDFFKNRVRPDGLAGWCKVCTYDARDLKRELEQRHERGDIARYHDDDDVRARVKLAAYEGHLKRKFGLTLDDYNELLEQQGGACAICGGFPKKRRLCVDHDHETGEVRALLCTSCNGSLHVLENPLILKSMTDYLTQHRTEI